MAATTYGTFGKYGLTSEAAKGLYASSLTCSVSTEQAWVKNHEGEDVGASVFNQSAEISLQGVTVNAATTGQSIAGVLSIANTDIFGTDTAASTFFVSGLTLSRTNSDFETGDVTAMGRPGITVS